MKGFKDRSRKLARESYWQRHDRDSYECPDCGRSENEIEGRFEVHHKNGEPLDNRPENRVGLCRLCHNLREGKKPSIEQIQRVRDNLKERKADEKQSPVAVAGIQSVYLAGSMTYHGDDDSWWSSSVRKANPATWRDRLSDHTTPELNSPRDLHFDHGGDLVEGVAERDLELLDQSDAILAYFDKDEQVGTLTELLYAISEGKPAVVLFARKYIEPPAIDPFDHVDRSYQWLNHPIGMRFESPVYWFLVNFLLGDRNWDGVEADVRVGVVSDASGIAPAYDDWVTEVANK
jgi:nucleoside 2-deoxyribosyltransferase